ncbi:MAG: HEAT repeat domain-containing protein [Candidatus Riflebacteria bacterium]|nr:HEAT repeat domain-containing protein [Candidatus Riflebacteria bacterium]
MDPYTQKLIESFQLSSKERKLKILPDIAHSKDEAVIPFLVQALGDEHWVVRKTAADFLFSFQELVIPYLSAGLSSYSEDVQHWSLQILTRLGKKSTPAILRAMKSPNSDVRHFACTALGELREPAGIAPLLKLLGDEKWPVRRAASEGLVQYGEEVIPAIEQVMNRTTDEDIRFWAIKSLGKLGGKAQRILLEALRTGNKQLRYVIAAALGESGDRRVIKVLIDSLADPDWTIRKSATQALAEIGENAIDPLIEALKEPNEDVRDGCLLALVRIGDIAMNKLFDTIAVIDDNQRYLIRKSMVKLGSRVVEALLRLFRAGKPEIMTFCAATLGEIGNPRAVPVLIDGLSHESWTVRRSCAYALGEIGERGVEFIAEALKSANDDVRYWVTRILDSIGEAGMPYLVRALSDKNKNIRFYAAKALRGSSNPETVRHLIKALSDTSWSVRKIAAKSIMRMEGVSIEHLLRNISNDNEDIRYWVGQILLETGSGRLNQIHECLKPNDPELRLYACQALGIIADPRSTEMLIDVLKVGNEWVRIYAAVALGRIGDARAVIPLIESLSDRNAEVHRNIMLSFQKLGSKVFEAISTCVESKDQILRRNSAIAIGELKEERGIDLLVMLLSDSVDKVRQAAAEALASFPGLKAHAMLIEALKDSSHLVRQAAIASLAEHARPEGITVIFDFLSRVKDDRETRIARRNLLIMAQKNPRAFVTFFTHEAAAWRTLAADALAGVGLPILPMLSGIITESKDETTVFWAQKVVKMIRGSQESHSEERETK